MSLEAWLEFRRNEHYEETKPHCYWCGNECSGDTTETVEIVDGLTAEKPICDKPEECPIPWQKLK